MNQYANSSIQKTLTITDLHAMKQAGEKITCLTAYDASFASVMESAGIDMILVGDSLGMVMQGQSSTLPVTVADMVYHTACVCRGRQRSFVIADMPFMSYSTVADAAKNAARLIQAGGAQMVKLEGARSDVVHFLTEQGVLVCGHLGLLPQSINQLGRYKVQGKTEAAAGQIMADALKLEQAGAAMLVLECVPGTLAKEITRQLTIPVIGIGAGIDCDGQVLVVYDMLNISTGKRPRFSKDFMRGADSIQTAFKAYCLAVKDGSFPAEEHGY